ncbi:MAG: phosphocarrier protein HPr [Coxiella sp. DG_40]|nr:MAG: phosphocarrier protein HPr [Coxiella sp. DG_40]
MIQKKLLIKNKLGLHTRAASKLVQHASCYASDIKITVNSKTVSAKSIMGVMLLAASKGTKIILTISGKDEAKAMADLESLIDDKFGEEK